MKFTDFVNGKKSTIDEGLSSGHGKVEMALRAFGLKYETETDDHGKVFVISAGDYEVESWNNGKIVLKKAGKTLGKIQELDFKKIVASVTDLLKDHIKPTTEKTSVEKEPEKKKSKDTV